MATLRPLFILPAILLTPVVSLSEAQTNLDPWGCPYLDACLDGPPPGFQPDIQDKYDFVDLQIDGVSGGGNVDNAQTYNSLSDVSIQLPGVWSYYSSVTGGRGLKVNGSEQIYLDTTSTPATQASGHKMDEIIDQAGNKHTYFSYAQGPARQSSPRLLKIFYAGGGTQTLIYDSRGNVKKREFLGDDGTSLIEVEQHFPPTCTNALTCNKPEWTKNANGKQTDYVYSAAHGQVLSEKSPPDENGIRPETRYQYTQRYAWIAASGGGYVQAASPVWLLETESYCRTSNYVGNACTAGASDEVVTTYDYGPNSGPNNLWLRGTAVTADGESLRTCYTYDVFGNRLTETAPNAALTSCP